MKTVCLYFQVHQPWRLKKYRFFNMGKDHNYLDDLLNRSIMQKVARQCYLPMNALLLKTGAVTPLSAPSPPRPAWASTTCSKWSR